VFGRQDSKIKGKTRTMSENRKFLDNLCEQVHYKGEHGYSSLPQSIIFDLEIPESAIVLNAQDEGKLLSGYHQYCAAARAFDELAKRVQYVLNMPVYHGRGLIERFGGVAWVPKFAALVVVLVVFYFNVPVPEAMAPRPIAPQELATPSAATIEHRFGRGESIARYAKYSISWFRAVVPSQSEVQDYIRELVAIHNLTSAERELPILNPDDIPEGTTVRFYPPSNLVNLDEKELVPVYRYFMKLVKDDFPYVTGDWCERGTGGGQPHFGIDVAGKIGTPVITPIDGVAMLKYEPAGGNTLGVITDNAVLFFCHLDKRFFKNGDRVRAGDTIGTIGVTGRTSGPHVHVGYAVRSQSKSDIMFGKYRYLVTDPKLFYYRQVYIAGLTKKRGRR
jgi:murein DD-endopeptidase MepM/ murein hydrolase activator NlpD